MRRQSVINLWIEAKRFAARAAARQTPSASTRSLQSFWHNTETTLLSDRDETIHGVDDGQFVVLVLLELDYRLSARAWPVTQSLCKRFSKSVNGSREGASNILALSRLSDFCVRSVKKIHCGICNWPIIVSHVTGANVEHLQLAQNFNDWPINRVYAVAHPHGHFWCFHALPRVSMYVCLRVHDPRL